MSTSVNSSIITVALLGKTGFGKSATGNTLLDCQFFDETPSLNSVTKLVTFKKVETDYGYILNVFDMPGLTDSEKDPFEDIRDSCLDMERLMKVCKGVTAFLLVYDINSKVSTEEKKTFENIEKIFGPERFWKHCILVLTKEDARGVPNVKMFAGESPILRKYIDKCGNRVVPVCNKDIGEKKLQSRKKLMDAIIALKRSVTSEYTLGDFQSCDADRGRFILRYDNSNKDHIYNKEINSIKKERMLVKNKAQREALLQKIAELKARIMFEDNGTTVIKDYLESLDLEVKAMPDPWCVIS